MRSWLPGGEVLLRLIPRPADHAPVLYAPRTTGHRVFAATVQILGAALAVWSVWASFDGFMANWASVVLTLVAVMIVSPFTVQVTAGREAISLGVAVSILTVMNFGHSTSLSLAIWTAAMVANQIILRRPPLAAAFWSSVAVVSAASFLAVDYVLQQAGLWVGWSYPVATAVYIVVGAGLCHVNSYFRRNTGCVGMSMRIRWTQLGQLWLINIGISWLGLMAQAFSVNGMRLPGTNLSALSAAVLTIVCLVVQNMAMRSRLVQTRLKLNVLLDAAHELPWRDVPPAIERLGVYSSVAVPGDSVHVQVKPAGDNQMGARIDFPDGHSAHIVVTREGTMGAFSSLESRVLSGLAHMATVTMKVNHGMQELETQAVTDELTGLFNYRAFLDALGTAAAGDGRDDGIAILYIDVDGLKMVNDTYGHDVGNELLVEMSARIKAILREHDIVARIGGDEFCAILGNDVTLKEAEAIRQRVETDIRTPMTLAARHFAPSASVGMAYSGSLLDAKTEDLVIAADRDMYRRKTAKAGLTADSDDRPVGRLAAPPSAQEDAAASPPPSISISEDIPMTTENPSDAGLTAGAGRHER
jgi:diguanylate cyclase (GGDEF)-like protein